MKQLWPGEKMKNELVSIKESNLRTIKELTVKSIISFQLSLLTTLITDSRFGANETVRSVSVSCSDEQSFTLSAVTR